MGHGRGRLSREERLTPPERRFARPLRAALACALLAGGCAAALAGSRDGTGWTVTRLDLEVRVSDDEPSIELGGRLTARLDEGRSLGPGDRSDLPVSLG